MLKRGLFPENIRVNSGKKCEISGMTSGSINPKEAVHLRLHQLSSGFQLETEEILSNENGLIDRDILKEYVIKGIWRISWICVGTDTDLV
jgi:hypothetical protein